MRTGYDVDKKINWRYEGKDKWFKIMIYVRHKAGFLTDTSRYAVQLRNCVFVQVALSQIAQPALPGYSHALSVSREISITLHQGWKILVHRLVSVI